MKTNHKTFELDTKIPPAYSAHRRNHPLDDFQWVAFGLGISSKRYVSRAVHRSRLHIHALGDSDFSTVPTMKGKANKASWSRANLRTPTLMHRLRPDRVQPS